MQLKKIAQGVGVWAKMIDGCQDCFRNQEIKWPPDVPKRKLIKLIGNFGSQRSSQMEQ